MGLTNCKLVMTEYVYSQNPLYELRLPISLIAGILAYRAYDKKLKNTFIRVLFPIVVTILVFTLIHFVTYLFVDQIKVAKMIQACESWKRKNEPVIIPSLVAQYANQMAGHQASQSQGQGHVQVKEAMDIQYAMPSNLRPKIEQFSLFGSDDEATPANPAMQTSVEMNITPPMQNSAPVIMSSKVEDSNQYDLDANPLDTYQRPENVRNMGSPRPSDCMLGLDTCSPLCSGDGQNPCNIVAPIPSVAWQPRSAAAVQRSLERNQFTANTCLP